jgi:hypothetical protein
MQQETSNTKPATFFISVTHATQTQPEKRRKIMEAKEIAVRLYENKTFGTTYGKGLYRSAVFNATADVMGHNTKYLLDYHQFDKFEHMARTDEQLEVLRDLGSVRTNDLLFSWVLSYDATTKCKTPVYGYSFINTKDNTLALALMEQGADEWTEWVLTAKPCKTTQGKNSPTLLATNAQDLSTW